MKVVRLRRLGEAMTLPFQPLVTALVIDRKLDTDSKTFYNRFRSLRFEKRACCVLLHVEW